MSLLVSVPSLVVGPPVGDLAEAHAAVDLWEHYSGKRLDDAQRLSVEHMMCERDGGWAARTTGRVEPRQNGKGEELEVVEAWGLVQRGEWIVHTAHEIPTAKSAHERMVGFLESHRDLRRLVDKVGYANGNQHIRMTSGAVVVYRTRTAGGGRGLDDISRLVVDEAQHAQPEQLASSMPILAANPNPQTNFVGSAGIAERSDWWWELRVRALRASLGVEDAGEFAWLEHSAEKLELSPDGKVLSSRPDVEDKDAWYRANHALGVRIEEAFLEEELRTLGPDLFAREHLCVWDPYPGDQGGFLPYDKWMQLAVVNPTGLSGVSYGLAVDRDGKSAAVASAARMKDGSLYVDIVRDESGTGWLEEALTDLYSRKKKPVRVNPSAPEGAVVRNLDHAGFEIEEVAAREYQKACGEILDSVKNGVIRHLDQETLNRAVRTAERRDVGKDGGWVWAEPVSQVDITPLRAATLALTGVSKQHRPRIY